MKLSHIQLLDPEGMPTPGAHYSQVVVSTLGTCRMAFLSGQVGASPSGSTPGDIDIEAGTMWSNVKVALAAANFPLEAIVKITLYVVIGSDIRPPSVAREQLLGAHKPASTLVYVAGLAKPEWHYEVDVIATMPVVSKRDL
jgi:2-iminobutanoate/2-iminopropanoate deaminase